MSTFGRAARRLGWPRFQTLVILTLAALLIAFVIVFLAGFRQLITNALQGVECIADLALGSGLVFVGITLVGDAMEGGAALDAEDGHPDVSVIRALTDGHTLLFGSIGCVLLALMDAASGYVILASGALPRWTGTAFATFPWLAWVIVVGAVTIRAWRGNHRSLELPPARTAAS